MSLPPLEDTIVALETQDGIDDRLDLFFIRYNTPGFIMDVITREMNRMMNDVNLRDIITLGLYRVGAFKITYIPAAVIGMEVDGGPSPEQTEPELQVIYLGGIENVINNISQEAIEYFSNYISTNYVTLMTAMFYKIFYEKIIRTNFNLTKSFTQCCSIDLYFNRSSDQFAFHVDSTPTIPVNFFTLTYLLPPGIEIVGPTVVSNESLTIKTSYTTTVMHGSTIGIDNDVVLHSTPSMDRLSQRAHPGTLQPYTSPFPPHASNPVFNFIEHTPYVHRTPRQEQAIMNTRNQIRTFIRTWFFVHEIPHTSETQYNYNTYQYDLRTVIERLTGHIQSIRALYIVPRAGVVDEATGYIDTETVLYNNRPDALGGKIGVHSNNIQLMENANMNTNMNANMNTNMKMENMENTNMKMEMKNMENILLDSNQNIILYTIKKTKNQKNKGGKSKSKKLKIMKKLKKMKTKNQKTKKNKTKNLHKK
jgi:hypothetical protein